jgi:hypothetical protein
MVSSPRVSAIDHGVDPNIQFFSYIMARTSYIRRDENGDVRFLLDQHAELDHAKHAALLNMSQ